MTDRSIGLLGASSFVGRSLRPLLETQGHRVICFSRENCKGSGSSEAGVTAAAAAIENWLCLAPIWTLPGNFEFLEAHGIKRLVALSSTSRYSKIDSPSSADRAIALNLKMGEEQVEAWSHAQGCTVTILQPTLIYGRAQDQNVTEIARFIQRFGFFPLFGPAKGLRQPVYVDDVAAACAAALQVPAGGCRSYVISGQEVLSYRTMVERVFTALGRRPRFIRCPLMLFTLAVRLANLLPSCKGLTAEMAVRMNLDHNYDYAEAADDFGFSPRPFHPEYADVSPD